MKGITILGALALAIPVCAAEFNDSQQRTFQLGSGADRKLIVGNINGDIKITADAGNDIRVTVREHWRADAQADIDELRNDLKLEMTQTGNTVKIGLEGTKNNRGRRHGDVNFRHEFDISVPRDIAVEAKSINGSVSLARPAGDFHLKTINGRVDLSDAAGSGEVETINGKILASFQQNPSRPSRFKTINGMIDTRFQSNLSADLKLKSLHGDLYTDFDVSVTGTLAAGKSHRLDRNRTVRVGAGGIEHSFETLNGDIKVVKYGK